MMSIVIKVILYVTIVILGTFIVTVNSNQTMYNIVSLTQIFTLVNNMVDHGKNKLITMKYNLTNSNEKFLIVPKMLYNLIYNDNTIALI